MMMLCAGVGFSEEVRVAVASNFANCLKDIAPGFHKATGHTVVPLVGSTGRHFAQISAEAPFDVFLSADAYHAELLIEKGLAEKSSSFIYARGQLVLWKAQPSELGLRETLADENLKPVAMANPRLAPYGKAAQEVLGNLNLPLDLDGRIIQGTNVGQTWQFAASGHVKAALVALSQVKDYSSNEVLIIPGDLYSPIEQKAVFLIRAPSPKPAYEFLEYLSGQAAQVIIQSHGYLTGR